MLDNKEVKWHFESIDKSAGIAFASLRKENDKHNFNYENCRCLYFSPPYFISEEVNISLAWSSTRSGYFQQELRSLDGNELSFNSPEEVAEFVRRSYIGGGGGDHGGSPSDNSPDTPNLPELEGLSDDFIKKLEEFKSNSEICENGESFPFQWNMFSYFSYFSSNIYGRDFIEEFVRRLINNHYKINIKNESSFALEFLSKAKVDGKISFYDILKLAVSSPLKLASLGCSKNKIVGALVVAAFLLKISEQDYIYTDHYLIYGRYFSINLQYALKWLDSNLPSIGFSEAWENVI